MDKDLRDRLYWLTEELTEDPQQMLFEDEEEEPEFIAPPRRKITRAEQTERQQLQRQDPVEDRSAPVVKKKGIRGLVILAVLEIIGILLVMGWWLQWLI